MTFGNRLREARKSKKLTQRQLAEMIHAKHNSISDWENNKNKPDPDTIELICGALSITPNYLLGTSDETFSPSEIEMINQYRRLDNIGKNHISDVLQWEFDRMAQVDELSSTITEMKDDTPLPMRIIPYYSYVRVGDNGEIALGPLPPSGYIELPGLQKYKDVIYAIQLASSISEYERGDVLLIGPSGCMSDGDEGIFLIDGSVFILQLNDGKLISSDPDCKVVCMEKNAKCMGKITGLLDEDDIQDESYVVDGVAVAAQKGMDPNDKELRKMTEMLINIAKENNE